MMKPVVLMELTMRDWETGKILNHYDLKDYEETWGNVYNMFVKPASQDLKANITRTQVPSTGHACKFA